ncbi:MAG: hypothetical protein ACP6IS_00815 [Candidatus Asgardarchaeia archaeon]
MADWTETYLATLRKTSSNISELDDPFKRAMGYKLLAEEFYMMGYEDEAEIHFERAKETIASIKEQFYKDWSLGEIIKSIVSTGYLLREDKYTKQITNPYIRANVYIDLSKILASQSDFLRARKCIENSIEIINSLSDPFEKAIMLRGVINALQKIPRTRRKISNLIKSLALVINDISDPLKKIVALSSLSEIYKSMNNTRNMKKALKDAVRIAKTKINDSYNRVIALKYIAVTYSKVNLPEAAINVLRDAINEINKIEDEKNKMVVFSLIAEELGRLGKYKQAIEMALKIENDYKRDLTLKEIIKVIISKAEIELATYLLENLKDENMRSECQKDIVLVLIKYGKLKAAEMIADGIADEDYKVLAHGCLMCERIRMGLEELDLGYLLAYKERILTINPPEKKYMIINKFAKCLIGVGLYIESVDLIAQIDDPLRRLWNLKDIREEILK